MSILLKFYHGLPYPLKVLAASARGWQLRRWRYGPDTERLVEEALERETWSVARWQTWQEDQIAFVLHRAATSVPYYQRYWQRQKNNGNKASWDYLENWPVLKKEELRAHPQQFVSRDISVNQMFQDRTSGTTGTPITVYIAKQKLHLWYAIFEARIRSWYGVSIRDKWAILGGQMVVPAQQTHPPYGVHNFALNQLYLSTHHISSQSASWYTDRLKTFAPTHIIAYPSSAFLLASLAKEQNLVMPRLQVIFSNAEKLFDHQRKLLSEVFNCPVVDTYGMGEYVFGASECCHGRMHVWPEVGFLEVLDLIEDKNCDKNESGRFVITSLMNDDMPLIRYEVGDIGTYLGFDHCNCGRTLPQLGIIEGRMNDMIRTVDGREIFWLNPVFYGLSIKEAQIIQESLTRIRVCLVPASGYSKFDEDRIRSGLQKRLGNVEIICEMVDQIPRGKNGKFRSVISLVTD